MSRSRPKDKSPIVKVPGTEPRETDTPRSRTGKPRKAAPHPAIGWREWVHFPDLGVKYIKAKVDTGARTSSLHAFDLEEFTRDGMKFVRFVIHPEQDSSSPAIPAELPLLTRRKVKDSGGKTELRPVVEATVELMGIRWTIELTLTRRDAMGFRMLLGRQAIRRRFVVDPGASFLGGRRVRKKRASKRTGSPGPERASNRDPERSSESHLKPTSETPKESRDTP